MGAAARYESRPPGMRPFLGTPPAGAQFTCFTSTKVQKLTQVLNLLAFACGRAHCDSHPTSREAWFAPRLTHPTHPTHPSLTPGPRRVFPELTTQHCRICVRICPHQFTCVTSTKGRILTQELQALQASISRGLTQLCRICVRMCSRRVFR